MPILQNFYLRTILTITFWVIGLSHYALAACSISPDGVISSSCTDSSRIIWDSTYQNLTIDAGVDVDGQIEALMFETNHNFTNNGSLSVVGGSAFYSLAPWVFIDNFTNNGTLGTTSGTSNAVFLSGLNSVTNFTNNGIILGGGSALSAIDLRQTPIETMINNGTISGNIGIRIEDLYIDRLINSLTGSITGGSSSAIYNAGTIGSISNRGSISGNGDSGIDNEGTISSVTNSGTIYGIFYGIANNGTASIQSLTNTGTITGGNAGIYNWDDATIVTLNNGQGAGNAAGALTYHGKLPTNYNIIVNSPASYGKLSGSSLTGSTTFGIYSGSMLTKGTYAAVLSGLTSSNVSTATRSGIYNGTAWTLALESGSTTIWDLIVQSSATNTLASVQQNSNGLATVYNQQTAAYQAALSYDCQVYDQNNLCVSVGGRYTYAGPSPSSNQQAGLVILGYKPVQTFRVGAFADQSVNISTPTGFSQSKTSPMWGFFAKWHKNKDETGLGVQASAVTSASSLTATRPQLFNTEAGSGTTQFNGQGYQLTTNYHQPMTNNTSVVPYLGLRYTRINAGAYTENTTATVTSPLSYNAMAQNTFSAIAGLGVRSHLAEKLTGTASVGIQQNLNYSMGNYAGTGNITGLESFSVQMPGNVNSMATATAGMFYDINKRERVGLNVLWQQQPFIATNTTTALATYTIGF